MYHFRCVLLLTLISVLSFTTRSQHPLKVLSYNVLKGFQEDTAAMNKYVQWVQENDPDIVCYQEMNGFTQKKLEVFAQRYGHAYAVLAKETGYSVAITSRFPIENAKKVLANMWHGYISAEIKGIHVFNVHLSPFQYEKRLEEVSQVLEETALLPAGKPILIAGDFNSFQARDSNNYTVSELDKQRKRESGNKEIRNLNQGSFDYSVTTKMETAGYRDAVNLMGPTGFPYSMPTKKYDAPYKTRIRIDYIWLNPALASRVSEAKIIKDTTTDFLSDHYPVWLQLYSGQ